MKSANIQTIKLFIGPRNKPTMNDIVNTNDITKYGGII